MSLYIFIFLLLSDPSLQFNGYKIKHLHLTRRKYILYISIYMYVQYKSVLQNIAKMSFHVFIIVELWLTNGIFTQTGKRFFIKCIILKCYYPREQSLFVYYWPYGFHTLYHIYCHDCFIHVMCIFKNKK